MTYQQGASRNQPAQPGDLDPTAVALLCPCLECQDAEVEITARRMGLLDSLATPQRERLIHDLVSRAAETDLPA